MSEKEIIDIDPEPKQETPKPAAALAPVPIQAEKDGLLIGKTFEDQKRLASTWMDSGMVPKAYKKPAQVLAGLQFAIGLGLAPSIASLKNITVINGHPSIWGELPLELVRKSDEFESIDEYLIDHDKERIEFVDSWEDIYAAVCEVKRKGCKIKKFTFTKFQAEKAIHGIEAIWAGYYDVMMKRKVRAIAIKDEFTDIIGSRSIAEYDFHVAPDAPGMENKLKDVTGSVQTTDMDFL